MNEQNVHGCNIWEIRVIQKVMSNVVQLATLQHQTTEYRLVGSTNYCHIFE